jgi:hypothetical protein
MQTVSAEILLSGNLTNTVAKSGLSIPEVAILLSIHGVGSVIEIKVDGKDSRSTASERERLVGIYGEDVVSKLFPGAMPQFPKKLEDIGLRSADDEPASAAKDA